jgi:Raf kinase inhibitor-like YbhB/YbcL family protein
MSAEGKEQIMNIQSTDFKNNERLPDRFAHDHKNISPALAWTDVPEGTRELAIICDDPDAPLKTWVHWVMYEIPPKVTSLKQGLPKHAELKDPVGVKQGKNDSGNIGYDGPRPPKGPKHRYIFHLYALSEPLELASGATAQQLRNAMKEKVLAETQIIGIYSR